MVDVENREQLIGLHKVTDESGWEGDGTMVQQPSTDTDKLGKSFSQTEPDDKRDLHTSPCEIQCVSQGVGL